MVKRVLVLGGGSAGFLAAVTLKAKIPSLEVMVLKSSQVGIIGVGEGTTAVVPNFLHSYLNISISDFLHKARPSYKLGLKFIWGPRPFFHYTFLPQFYLRVAELPHEPGFYCAQGIEHASANAALMTRDLLFERKPNGLPLVYNEHGYHLENAHFAGYLEAYATALGVSITDDTVKQVVRDETGIRELVGESGRRFQADLFVDASGFASLLLGKALQEPYVGFTRNLFCDRAVVGGWDRAAGEVIKPYTLVENMECGWCWQIEHEQCVHRGYVYSSAFISDEQAELEFHQKNPRVSQTRVVRFISGCYERGWVKNVVAVGNAGGFVEPLEATSLSTICVQCRSIVQNLLDCDRQLNPGQAMGFNRWQRGHWDDIRSFLALHYKFNTRYETPFWKACRADTDLADAREYVDYYQAMGPAIYWGKIFVGGEDVFTPEGYLAMLVGMDVPYENRRQPTEQEQGLWRMFCQKHQAAAANGVSVNEALNLFRRPECQWVPGFYRFA